MPEIVDREREVADLRRLATAPPALVVLRGRRRVGKTYLLRVALAGKRLINLQAEAKPRPLQLDAFARECSRLLPGNPPVAFDGWRSAFDFIGRQALEGGPVVVILDEFQYLAASDPGLESTVQRYWDQWDADDVPVMLVLSGSALSFMESLLHGNRPTYGRASFRPLLLPLTYQDSAGFAARRASAGELIERYAVFGGTPQYQRWAGSGPVLEAIEDTCLYPDAPLHSEPENLIREEPGIREPGPYFGALESIAGGYAQTGAIAARLEISQQLTTRYLSRLADLGYIARAEPVEPRRPARARGYWRIVDPFFRFWFRYVLPNRSRLSRGRVAEVRDEISRDLSAHVGRVFEDCCREWIGRYSDLGSDAADVGSWWSRGNETEIDVVTVAKRRYAVLGSCKWTKRLVGEGALRDLEAAREVLGPAAENAQLVLFSRSGYTAALRRRADANGVTLVSVNDLFSDQRSSS